MDGLRIGVTGARKAQQLADALARHGATPVIGPLVTSAIPVDDNEVVSVTDEVIEAQPQWLAASTGVGMRLWVQVAQRAGKLDSLREVICSARRVARGAKAVGGLAALNLTAEHVTDEETDAAVVDWLRERVTTQDRVVAQVHGNDDDAYRELGDIAQLIVVRTYVAGRLPADEERARQLVHAITAGDVDIVTFTSPAAANNVYSLAASMGEDVLASVTDALGSRVAVAVIGSVTGEVFRQRGVPIAVQPARHRQGELVRALRRWSAG